MPAHDPRERKLFADLNEKNRLAGEFRRLSGRARRWRRRMSVKGSKRWQVQYGSSLERAQRRLDELRGEILSRAQDLKKRIEEEQKVSKAEVQEFEKQYKKEVAEMKQAQQELADAEKAFAEARGRKETEKAGDTQRSAVVLTELRRKRWNAIREAKRESQDVKRAGKEIESERSDAGVLSYELRRVIAEIESLAR